MAQAYAVILVDVRLYSTDRRSTVQEAQRQADVQFERLAQERRRTLVTRDPEPRVMTYSEMEQQFPGVDYLRVVGLYFTADIT